ncbi:MAG: glycosyltransferase 87 family protein [Thermoleophilaceae bacterium]
MSASARQGALAAAARARALPAWAPAALLLCAGWLATFGAGPWADATVNDLFVYRSYAELFLDGLVPFRDVAFEYPPLGALPLWLAGLAGTDAGTYRVVFALLMLAVAVATLLLSGRLARLTGGSEARALLAFAALPLLAGAMVRTHFDLLPVALALGAVAAVLVGRIEVGFALAGVGALTKAFPLLVALVALAWLLGRGDRRAAARGGAALAVTLALAGGAWVAVSPEGAWDAIAYHVERPVQVESVPATAINAAGALGLTAEPGPVFSHRSDGLVHAVVDTVAAVFAAALLAVLGWIAVAVFRRPGARALVLAALAAVAAFATLGTVLSPQFLIWVAPLGALAAAWRMWALAGAVAAATLLTFAEFPSRYFDVVAQEPFALALVGVRDAVLLGVVALALHALHREPRAWE